MKVLEEVILITTPHCKSCSNLVKQLVPVAKQYHLRVRHLIAKEHVTLGGKKLGVRLYENGKVCGGFPDTIPEQFPILIYGTKEPVIMVGEDSVQHLGYMIAATLNLVPSMQELIKDVEESNIDEVVEEYKQLPGSNYEGEIVLC